MIKKLGILLVLGALAAAGIKGYASYAAMQFIEQLKREHIKDLSLTYRWLSVDFWGNIDFEGVVITPYSLKRPISIENITLKFDGISPMLASLSELMSGSLPSQTSISYRGLSMPFKGRGLDEWVALSYGDKALLPMKMYVCGDWAHLDFSAMKAMGIDEIRARGQAYFQQEGGKDEVQFIVDVEKIGKFDFSIALSQGGVSALLNKKDVVYSEIVFKYQDAGYYRRLSNLCTEKTNIDVESYADLSAKQWRVEMGKAGIILNESAGLLYKERILQGGVFGLKSEPPEPVKLGVFESWFDKDLVSFLGLSASLNGEARGSLQIFLDGKSFRPEQKDEEKEPKIEGGQATVVLSSSSFQRTDVERLPEFIERKVRIQLHDGKSYQGVLKSANEKKIEVTLIFNAGTADYFFANEKIDYVEVWR